MLAERWRTRPIVRPPRTHGSAPQHFSALVALQSTRQTAATPMADATDPVPGWTRREQIELDGLKFDICVAASGGECIGVWKCRDCGEHGASARKNSTADQASTRAQIDLALITTWFTADHANQSESAHSDRRMAAGSRTSTHHLPVRTNRQAVCGVYEGSAHSCGTAMTSKLV